MSEPEANLIVPVIVEFHHRIRTASRPFKATARLPTGEEVVVCVKPHRHAWPDPREHIFLDWSGTALARLLRLPGPRMFVVELQEGFLRANSRELSDVIPGYAIATEWLSQAFHCGDMTPNPASVKNPATVAGVVVLDTLLQNRDRCNDVLVVPDGTAGGPRFRLEVIDNAGPVWFPLLVPMKLAMPDNYFLQGVLRRAPDYHGYVFAALTLHMEKLRVRIGELPSGLVHHGSPDTAEFIDTIGARILDVGAVVPQAL